MNTTLHFARGNAKLDRLEAKLGPVYSFSLLSGHTCPYAKDCQSFAMQDSSGRRFIQDGKHTLFRCFSASQEVLYTPVYNARKRNTDLVKSALSKGQSVLTNLLINSIPPQARVIRIHVGGDFMVQGYFDAWLDVADYDPSRIYYAYTKALPFWVKRLDVIPQNMVLTASYGGHRDDMIAQYGLRYSVVVPSRYAARKLRLPIDHDDSHAALPSKRSESFALLLHGVQPKGHKRPKYGYTRS